VKDRAVRSVVKTSVTIRWLRLSAMHAPLLLLKWLFIPFYPVKERNTFILNFQCSVLVFYSATHHRSRWSIVKVKFAVFRAMTLSLLHIVLNWPGFTARRNSSAAMLTLQAPCSYTSSIAILSVCLSVTRRYCQIDCT